MHATLAFVVVLALGVPNLGEGAGEAAALTVQEPGDAFPPESYSTYRRPPPRKEVTRVQTDCRLLHMYEINDVQSTVHGDLYIRLSWIDERLKFDKDVNGGKSTRRVQPKDIWRPGVILVNAQSRPESITEDASVSYDGLVTVVQRLDAHVTVDLDMKAYVATALVENFPWDSHEVKLIFTAFSYDASEVLLVPSKASQDFDIADLSASVWELGNWTIKGYIRKSVIASKDSNVIASFTATRMVFSSIFELVLPMALIAIFALSAGPIALDSFDVRVAVSSTSMLTINAFLYVVNSKLPDISYLAWIHYYTIMCFLCVFGVVVQVVLVHVIDPGAEGIERVEDLERGHLGERTMTVFETLLAMDRAHAVNAVLTTTFVALFVLGNFVLFVIVRPVTTLITTVVLLGIFIMGAAILAYLRRICVRHHTVSKVQGRTKGSGNASGSEAETETEPLVSE